MLEEVHHDLFQDGHGGAGGPPGGDQEVSAFPGSGRRQGQQFPRYPLIEKVIESRFKIRILM